MMDLSNVADVPIEEIKAGDEILIKCKVDSVCSNELHRFKIVLNSHTTLILSITKYHYVAKIEHPPKVGDRYKHEHGQPIRVILIVRNYAVVEYENAEFMPVVYTFDDLKQLEKLPPV